MGKKSSRFIPLKLPDGRTFMVSPGEYQRLCDAAASANKDIRDWLAEQPARDEDELLTRTELEEQR